MNNGDVLMLKFICFCAGYGDDNRALHLLKCVLVKYLMSFLQESLMLGWIYSLNIMDILRCHCDRAFRVQIS